MKIVDVNRIVDNVPADLVRLANDLAAFDAAPGHPKAERKGMMIAARDGLVSFAIFAERSAAKFRTPDDER